MKPRKRSSFSAIHLVAILSLSGCGGGPSPVQAAAERAEFDEIAPAHRAYVTADPALDEDQKARRLRTLELWGIRVEALEKAVQK